MSIMRYQVRSGCVECMKDEMKVLIVFVGIVVAFGFQIVFGQNVSGSVGNGGEVEGIRLRVIANSDDELDQVAKNVVVFAMEQFFVMNAGEFESYDVARDFLVDNLVEVESLAVRALTSIGDVNDVEVSFGQHFFPGSEGYYESLIVRIGDARGENWWCFINPGICSVPSSDEGTDINDVQYSVTSEIQENFAESVRGFFDGLFGNDTAVSYRYDGDVHVVDWFLFNDER